MEQDNRQIIRRRRIIKTRPERSNQLNFKLKMKDGVLVDRLSSVPKIQDKYSEMSNDKGSIPLLDIGKIISEGLSKCKSRTAESSTEECLKEPAKLNYHHLNYTLQNFLQKNINSNVNNTNQTSPNVNIPAITVNHSPGTSHELHKMNFHYLLN